MSDHMKTPKMSQRDQGFSLVEVMVAVVVICVGLLGIAKMQALALSNTTTARLRSLAAFEAASLASAMHSNRNYWATTPPVNITTTSNSGAAPTIASSDGGLQAAIGNSLGAWPAEPGAGDAGTCVEVSCTPVDLAGFDFAWWLAALNGLLPNPSATIACTQIAPAACTIQISWQENMVNNNKSEANNLGSQFSNPTYTLYVEP
jgi:type IV pilus assembly protein PilV